MINYKFIFITVKVKVSLKIIIVNKLCCISEKKMYFGLTNKKFNTDLFSKILVVKH